MRQNAAQECTELEIFCRPASQRLSRKCTHNCEASVFLSSIKALGVWVKRSALSGSAGTRKRSLTTAGETSHAADSARDQTVANVNLYLYSSMDPGTMNRDEKWEFRLCTISRNPHFSSRLIVNMLRPVPSLSRRRVVQSCRGAALGSFETVNCRSNLRTGRMILNDER